MEPSVEGKQRFESKKADLHIIIKHNLGFSNSTLFSFGASNIILEPHEPLVLKPETMQNSSAAPHLLSGERNEDAEKWGSSYSLACPAECRHWEMFLQPKYPQTGEGLGGGVGM